MSGTGSGADGGSRAEKAAVLVVDDDLEFARMLERLLSSEGYRAAHAGSAREALEALSTERFDLVLADMKMPDRSGIDLLKEVLARHSGVQVVIMTGYGTIQTTVEAMKLGAADFIPKPFDNDELLLHLDKVARVRSLEREVARLRGELRERYGFEGIVGSTPAMARVIEKIAAAAATSSNVLVSGESGTGKELVARAIHHNGPRAERRFVAINCAALPREIMESELFGHVRGAFTGAHDAHEGLFRAAHRGTLLLDEIAEMPVETQAKLLRAIEQGRVRPIGSTEEVEVDCRIIATTNRDPLAAVKRGELREDLYYRLSVITIELPPLRERREDIPLIVQHFVAQFNAQFSRKVRAFAPEALRALVAYPWPGNIRELRNVIEGAFALARGDVIQLDDLPTKLVPERPGLPAGAVRDGEEASEGEGCAAGEMASVPPLDQALGALERKLILRALELAKGNKSRAADMLRVSRKRVYRKLEDYGLAPDERVRAETIGRGDEGKP